MSTAFTDKVARLRETFLAQLPPRLIEARRLAEAIRSTADNQRPAEDLRLLLHNIKGASATFGFHQLHAAAEAAEALLVPLLGDSPALVAMCVEMTAQLDRLEEALAAPQGPPTPRSGHRTAADAPATTMAAVPEPKRPDAIRRIYLCDDDPIPTEQLRLQIASFGYEVTAFSTPAALLAAVRTNRPDALIMDAVFAEGREVGFEAVALLRRAGIGIPALFLSCRDDFDARLHAVQAGGAAYFTKPVRVMDVVERLDALTSEVQPEPFRVLVVDDEPEVAAYHALILEEAGMLVRVVIKPETVLDTLRDFRADLMLMDIYMPRCNGRELAQLIRQIPDFTSLPIVFLSNETDTGKQFSAMRLGADGFLTKPIEPSQLVSAVLVRAERMRVLRSLMVRDSLTGLFNHTTTEQMLDAAVASARRRVSPLCFAMIDIDHFKMVNDTHGHPAGDQVLLALSRVLRQYLRTSDIVGRYGGEEFAAVLCDVNLDKAASILDNLRQDFSRLRFQANGVEFSVTFSCGVAEFPVCDSPQILRRTADKVLYQAKHGGRNRVLAAVPDAERD